MNNFDLKAVKYTKFSLKIGQKLSFYQSLTFCCISVSFLRIWFLKMIFLVEYFHFLQILRLITLYYQISLRFRLNSHKFRGKTKSDAHKKKKTLVNNLIQNSPVFSETGVTIFINSMKTSVTCNFPTLFTWFYNNFYIFTVIFKFSLAKTKKMASFSNWGQLMNGFLCLWNYLFPVGKIHKSFHTKLPSLRRHFFWQLFAYIFLVVKFTLRSCFPQISHKFQL